MQNDSLSSVSQSPATNVQQAGVVLLCSELQPNIDFFLERLGFRLERISPADDPRMALIFGHGLLIELRRGANEAGSSLRLACADPVAFAAGEGALVAPNGTRIELLDAQPVLDIPIGKSELVVTRAGEAAKWITGRAGMHYRDLIPGRWGGRFIASNIKLPDGGPVPDSVHFHSIRLQMIFCTRGWVRVVYEGQGPPFVLEAGDAVLQPANIRHRVLESSAGMEVLELACPAEHDTHLDHELVLPTAGLWPERVYSGQRFVRHIAREAHRQAWDLQGYEYRDLGITRATDGVAGAKVVSAVGEPRAGQTWRTAAEFQLLYVLAGRVQLEGASAAPITLERDDCVALPAGLDLALVAGSPDLEFLEIRLPG